MKYVLTAIFISFFLSSCTTMDSMYQRGYFTKISYEDCNNPSEQMYVFYEDEKLDFPFTKIGLIKMEGEVGFTRQQVYDRFLYAAWNNCSNGIIFTEYSQIQKVISGSESEWIHVFEGLAVQIEMDSVFLSNHGDESEMNFLENINEWEQTAYDHDQKIKKASGSFWLFMVTTGLVVLAAL